MAEARPARNGTKQVSLDFEREILALWQLFTLGRSIKVLAPEALRSRLCEMAADLSALYGPP